MKCIIIVACLLQHATAAADVVNDPVLRSLALRNLERNQAFDDESARYRAEMDTRHETTTRDQAAREALDHETALTVARAEQREARSAELKTAAALSLISLGLMGLAAKSYAISQDTRDRITEGRYGTGSAISSAATQVQVEEAIAYGAGGVGVLLGIIGLVYVW